MGMRSATKCARYDPLLTAQVPLARSLHQHRRSETAPRSILSTNYKTQPLFDLGTGSWRAQCYSQRSIQVARRPSTTAASSKSRANYNKRPSSLKPGCTHQPHWKWGGSCRWASEKCRNLATAIGSAKYSTASTAQGNARPAGQLASDGYGDIAETTASIVERWTRIAIEVRQQHGIEASWRHLETLRTKDAWLLAEPDAEILRREILWAAVQRDDNLEDFCHVVKRLRFDYGFQWPQLWAEVMFRLIKTSSHKRTISWHERLYMEHRPSRMVLITLLVHFSAGASPKMLWLLQKLHRRSREFQLYDELIPQVFSKGSLASAMAWRKHLVYNHDFPKDRSCHTFIDFVLRYYPRMRLSDQERAIILLPDEETLSVSDRRNYEGAKTPQTLVARWFASTWTSVDFAISLVQRFGIKHIGPHALQALALRTPEPQALRERFKQLRDLDITVEPTMYCQLIQHFADQDRGDLLMSLLRSDVHPDEFQDPETMRLLLSAALDSGDVPLERLTRAILQFKLPDQGISTTTSWPDDTSSEIRNEVLAASRSLRENVRRKHRFSFSPSASLHLKKALDLARKATEEGVGVPTEFWQKILFNLGRLGRFQELEGLSLEILKLYSEGRTLIAVHGSDLPKIGDRAFETSKAAQDESDEVLDGLQRWQQAVDESLTRKDERTNTHANKTNIPDGYIHHDLPFYHECHPVRLIFGARLQRSIIRWSFAAGIKRATNSKRRALATNLNDITIGLRILRTLRDGGVLIDLPTVRSALVGQSNVANLPQRRTVSRDQVELDHGYLVELFEQDWGSPVFDSREHFEAMLAARAIKSERKDSFSRLVASRSTWSQPEPIEVE